MKRIVKNQKELELAEKTAAFIPQPGHARPLNRRDLLKAGLINFAGGLLLPSISSRALAASTGCQATSVSLPAFIEINLPGGAGLMANIVPFDKDRLLLPSYSKMGMGTSPNITRMFGNVPFNTASGFYSSFIAGGFNQSTVANKTVAFSVSVKSQDDSDGNLLSALGLVAKAGVAGTTLPILQNTGVESVQQFHTNGSAVYVPPAPLRVGDFNDILNGVRLNGAIANILNDSGRTQQGLLKLIRDLSALRATRIQSSSSTALSDAVRCQLERNRQFVTSPASSLDPRVVPALSQIWGLTASTLSSSASLISASIVYNTLIGNATAGSLLIGGFDYHGLSTTFSKDKEAADMIKKVLQSAEALGKPVFIYVTSDGSVGSGDSPTSTLNDFTIDRGDAGLSLMFAYSPTGRPLLSLGPDGKEEFQLGHFDRTPGAQGVDSSTIVGASTGDATTSVFANYLSFGGKLDSIFRQVVDPTRFSDASLAEVVKMKGPA
jgi:hypothetical protein